MRTTRKGATDRYLSFLLTVKSKIDFNEHINLNEIAAQNHISKYASKAVVKIGFVKMIGKVGSERKFLWIIGYPTEKQAKKLLVFTNGLTNKSNNRIIEVPINQPPTLTLDIVCEWLGKYGYTYTIEKAIVQKYTNINPSQS